jgi:alpha-L-rhamnosidase
VLEPRFTFHGFRYAQVDGWPGEFDPTAVEAVVIHSDLRRTGWFSSSDATLDRFHENVVWTTRGNYLGVPMDCPQRDERLGWTGDTQLFAPTASFLFDTHGFYLSWMRELALSQSALGGVVPLMAPNPLPGFGDREPIAAWGDAIAIMPHVLADRFGDPDVLGEFFPAIRDWAEVLLRVRDADGLWTTGRQLGDWLDPIAPPNAPSRARTDADLVASAYLVHTLGLAARTAASLGRDDEAARYARETELSRGAFHAAFITPAGRMTNDAQTAYVLALRLGVVIDPELRTRLGRRLADVVRRDGYVIGAGIVGTPHLAPALTEAGHVAEAERLLFQTECPSWLYPVTVGATTVWERWDGLRPDGTLNPGSMISFNHVVLGGVADWLHTTVAGLAPAEPGYRRLRVAPRPLSRLDHARAVHLTPYGPASVEWRREDGGVRLTVEVPPNATAEVELGELRAEVGSGTHEWLVAVEATPAARPVTLDSTTAELIDDEPAYRAFFATIAALNPYLATSVRLNVLWTRGRTVRDALIFADKALLDAVAQSFVEVAAGR